MQLGKPKAFAHTVGVLYATGALAGVCVCVCLGEGGEGFVINYDWKQIFIHIKS